MPVLSIIRNGLPARSWIHPAYPVTELKPNCPGEFVFEVLEADGEPLKDDIGQRYLLTADGGQVFWGELLSLTPCTSTVAGLALMRNRPALRGVLRVFPDANEIIN
jgi:hypothetical protein